MGLIFILFFTPHENRLHQYQMRDISNHGISRIFIDFFLPDFPTRPKKKNYLSIHIFYDLFKRIMCEYSVEIRYVILRNVHSQMEFPLRTIDPVLRFL
jgi:hypothetical protein